MDDDLERERDREPDAPSNRALKRQRRCAADIVEAALRDLRPSAPFQEIRRLVAARCAAVGVTEPTRHALVAKIAEVRRFEHRPKLITLDHCILETVTGGTSPELCTLHVAILDPPGAIIAWRVVGGPADPRIDADLLIELQTMSGPFPDARVRLASSGPIAENIGSLLAATGVETVVRTMRERGSDAKRLLSRPLAPNRILLRAPRATAEASWAAPSAVTALRRRVSRLLGGGTEAAVAPSPVFGMAPSYRTPDLVNALRRITAATPE